MTYRRTLATLTVALCLWNTFASSARCASSSNSRAVLLGRIDDRGWSATRPASLDSLEPPARAAANEDRLGARRAYVDLIGAPGPVEAALLEDGLDGRWDEHTLPVAAIIAGGVVDADAVASHARSIDHLAVRAQRIAESRRSAPATANALVAMLHRSVFRSGYELNCTSLAATIDDGRFNCVTGSILFHYLAQSAGLRVRGLQMPGHAMVRLYADRALDVETTNRDASRSSVSPASAERREVTPVQLVAMLYYNRGVELLTNNRFEESAAVNAKALWLDPVNDTAWGNLMATFNNWAIALAAEGRFEEAVALLDRGAAMDPSYATFEPNHLHVYHRWASSHAEKGRFAEAVAVLDRAEPTLGRNARFRSIREEIERAWSRELMMRGRVGEAFDLNDRAGDAMQTARRTAEEVLDICRVLDSLRAAGADQRATDLLAAALERHPRSTVLMDQANRLAIPTVDRSGRSAVALVGAQ